MNAFKNRIDSVFTSSSGFVGGQNFHEPIDNPEALLLLVSGF